MIFTFHYWVYGQQYHDEYDSPIKAIRTWAIGEKLETLSGDNITVGDDTIVWDKKDNNLFFSSIVERKDRNPDLDELFIEVYQQRFGVELVHDEFYSWVEKGWEQPEPAPSVIDIIINLREKYNHLLNDTGSIKVEVLDELLELLKC
jgi:hypothetical protein